MLDKRRDYRSVIGIGMMYRTLFLLVRKALYRYSPQIGGMCMISPWRWIKRAGIRREPRRRISQVQP